MKSKKPVGILAVILLVISLFLGIVIVSIAIGSIIPSINKISAPFVCRGGSMEVGQSSTNPRPGETYVSVSISCVDKQTGEQEVKTIPAILVSGLIYSLLIFVVSMTWFLNHPDSWGTVPSESSTTGKSNVKRKA